MDCVTSWLRRVGLVLSVLIVGTVYTHAEETHAGQETGEQPVPSESVNTEEQPAPQEPKRAEDQKTESDPAALLTEADAALTEGDLERASTLYRRIIQEHPDSPEAPAAKRAVKIIEATHPGKKSPEKPEAEPEKPQATPEKPEARPVKKKPKATDDTFYRLEPYSVRTSERLRLTWWEKLDFGVTAFIYGLSVGFSYSLALEPGDSSGITGPMAGMASVYTLASILYLYVADPDRGDLPLALAIAAYIPTTALLVANANPDWRDDKSKGLAIGVAGTLAIPAAGVAAHYLDLDPGDAQLTRDVGFWCLVLSVLGTMSFAGDEHCDHGYCSYSLPSQDKVAIAGLVGLYGGLGLGVLTAAHTEISLERVRASTWGGYGGMILGGLIGGATESQAGSFRGMTIGGAAGLILTFIATPMIDKIPDDTPMVDDLAYAVSPATIPVVDARGNPGIAWGLRFILP